MCVSNQVFICGSYLSCVVSFINNSVFSRCLVMSGLFATLFIGCIHEMIFASGSNFFGQLGTGSKQRAAATEIIPFAECEEQALDTSKVADVQCGSQFTVTLHKNGNVGLCGTLNGTVYPILSPLEIPLPIRCVQVACGRRHILLLMEKSIVMSWGTGYFGQLGHGDDTSWDSPRMIGALDPKRLGCRAMSVACGASHSGVVTDSGRVFMWGLNRSGQCGQGQSTKGKSDSVLEPRPVDFSSSNIGANELGPIVPKQLVCGRNHSAVITHTGRVFVWGEAGFGRLGLNEVKKAQMVPAEVVAFRGMPAAQLAAGDFHMMALTLEGHVYSWGYGADGQTGHSTMLNVRCPRRVEFFDDLRVREVQCGATWSMAVTMEGDLYSFGYGDGGWLCLDPPNALEQLEVDSLSPAQASLLPESHQEICCFDSRYSVLRPKRVVQLADYAVRSVRAGAGHTVVLCEPRVAQEQISGIKHSPRDQGISGAKAAMQSTPSPHSSPHSPAFAPAKAPPVELAKKASFPVSSKYDAKPTSTAAFAMASQGKTPAGDISGSGGSSSSLQQRAPPHLLHLHSQSANDVLRSHVAAPLSPSAAVAQVFSWCRHRKITELTNYLAEGGNADCLDGAGNTPLIVACQNGSLQICKLLLSNGADLNAQNHKGNTALHYCYNYGYEDIGTYLIEHGADDLQTNAEGLTCYEGLTHSDLELL